MFEYSSFIFKGFASKGKAISNLECETALFQCKTEKENARIDMPLRKKGPFYRSVSILIALH